MLDGSVETDRKAAETETCKLNKELKMCSNRQEIFLFYFFPAISALFYNRDLKSTVRPPEKMISATRGTKIGRRIRL